MDVSANKVLELNGRDAEILISSSTLRIHAKPALDEGVKLNGGIRNSSIIRRMVVEGYDTSPRREDVEEALKKHFVSRRIKLMHVSVPVDYKCRFDTCLSLNDIEKMLLRVFPGSDCFPLWDGSVLLYLRGQYAMDEALKLSGGSVQGFKFVVTEVFPETVIETGISLATARSFGFRG
ncbi:hypothetical protein HID58_008508 [Brassica napus]|uniref:Uncharacterized protein n=1 Tax=Brassica napus TaxID=3708 RepID=A0ABQ8DPW6_BRANA|nr:hypothetical protein HID58_008508 [Brassica napus]